MRRYQVVGVKRPPNMKKPAHRARARRATVEAIVPRLTRTRHPVTDKENPGHEGIHIPVGNLTRKSGSPCPFALECRHWIFDTETEKVECAHCYQELSRATLAHILAGSR